jgi:type IV pilus assembly protein PilB
MLRYCFQCELPVEAQTLRCPNCASELGLELRAVEVVFCEIDPEKRAAIAANDYDIPSIDLDELEITPDVIALIDGGFARDLKVLPVRRSGGTLTVAVIEPTKGLLLMDQLRKRSRLDIELVIATKVAMARALERYYGAK